MGQVRLHDLHAKHTELLLGVHPHGGREDMAFKVTFLPEHRHAFVCTYQVRLRARARARLRLRVRVRVPAHSHAFVCTYQVQQATLVMMQ